MEIRRRISRGEKPQTDKKIIKNNLKEKKYNFKIIIPILLFGIIFTIIMMMPDVIDPYPYSYPMRPNMSGVLAPNKILSMAERKAENELFGPESFATYNGQVYTSTKKGIFRLKESRIEFVARIGKPPCDTLADEVTCGRPLGMEFDAKGLLYVADSYLGIYRINTTTNKIDEILGKNRIDKEKIKFINSLQISHKGHIYFTSTSSRWDRNQFIYAILEAQPDGRVFKYDPQTEKLNVIVGNLLFPNGLLLSHDENNLFISETVKATIQKYNLLTGKLEAFSENLPLLPDNIKYNDKGNIMVTAAALRFREKFSIIDFLAPRPYLKKLLFKIIRPEWILNFFPKYGLVIEINSKDGSIVQSYHDPDGKVYAISEAMQIGNKLYLGSYITPFYSVINIKD